MNWNSLQTSWNQLKTNWIIGLTTKGVLALYCFSLLVLLLTERSLPPLVPLWYSAPWGVDRLAHPLWLFLLPCFGLVWQIINMIIAFSIPIEYLTFIQFLFINSFLVNLLASITLLKIIMIVL